MARTWRYWDLFCRNCRNTGTLGIWVESDDGDDRWDGDWKNFYGVLTKEGPVSVQCSTCTDDNIAVTDRAASA
jgi:hypothetical protein